MCKKQLVTVRLEIEITYELQANTTEEELLQQVAEAADYLVIDKVLTGYLPVLIDKYRVETKVRVGNVYYDLAWYLVMIAAYTVVVLSVAGVL